MNSCTRFLLAAASLLTLQSAVMAQSSVRPDIKLTEKAVGHSGTLYDNREISVGGMAFGDYYYNGGDNSTWATWRVPEGYRTFKFFFGCDDSHTDPDQKYPSDVLQVFLDGQLYRSYEVFPKQRPLIISIPVVGISTIKIEITGSSSRAIVAEPRLLATASGSAPTTVGSSAPMVNNYPTANTSTAAPYAVSAKDINELVANIRETVANNPALQARIDRAQIAVASFDLIDISYGSVAKNVAENLSTSMIKAGFRLIERGQLQNVLNELKIQNTGLMDPKTIQKIGVLSGCDVIVVGSVSDQGQYLSINCRLLETATAKSLAAEQQDMPKVMLAR